MELLDSANKDHDELITTFEDSKLKIKDLQETNSLLKTSHDIASKDIITKSNEILILYQQIENLTIFNNKSEIKITSLESEIYNLIAANNKITEFTLKSNEEIKLGLIEEFKIKENEFNTKLASLNELIESYKMDLKTNERYIESMKLKLSIELIFFNFKLFY